MARIYSKRKGKSGSHKPSKRAIPSWCRYKPKEVELLIVKYAKEGKKPSQIGLYLRDEYGIPDSKLVTKKSITKILQERNLLAKTPEDLVALMRKMVLIKKHLDENKKDMPALRGMQLTESKINRLVKYYKRGGKLPADWKYDPSNARLHIE